MTAANQQFAPSNRLVSLLRDARQKLIQTGTRNRLVHTARFGKQGKYIDIVDERSDDVFRILNRDQRRMRFDHDPSAKEKSEDGGPLLVTSFSHIKNESRFTDLALQTRMGEDKLQKKLLGLAREAKTLEEEQGINALYLALGFLRWYEDDNSQVLREAPLVLLPVALQRNARTSLYELVARGEDIVTNEPLKRRLQDDAAIKLPEIPEGDDWLPSAYFSAVRDSITGKSRWSIDDNGIQLGFFSFAKLLMVKDLEPENWGKIDIFSHPILSGLLQDGFDEVADDFPDDRSLQGSGLDQIFKPADLVQIVDADASQALVIETIRKDRNLVVQGPPGTGKSQTITNIIAAAVHDGKSVLFVAEKMAALNVVHDRLVKAGLQDICLELHSRSANKKLVAEELGRTLGAAATVTQDNNDVIELTKLRDRLNQIAGVLHRPIGQSGITAFKALSTLINLSENGFAPSDIKIANIERWSAQDRQTALSAATELANLVEAGGPLKQHPFFGVNVADMLPTDVQRLKLKLEALLPESAAVRERTVFLTEKLQTKSQATSHTAQKLSSVMEHIAGLPAEAAPYALAIAAKGAIDRARFLAEAGLEFQRAKMKLSGVFNAAALETPVTHLRQPLVGGYSFFARLRGPYKRASAELQSFLKSPLPKTAADRVALIDRMIEVQKLQAHLKEHSTFGADLLGPLWLGEKTNFDILMQATEWSHRLLSLGIQADAGAAIDLRRADPQKLRDAGHDVFQRAEKVRNAGQDIFSTLQLDLHSAFGTQNIDEMPYEQLEAKLASLLGNMGRIDEWSRMRRADQYLRTLAGDEFTDSVARGDISPSDVLDTIRYIHAETLYRQFVATESWAIQLTAADKASLTLSFREREKARLKATAKGIRHTHLSRLPRGAMGAMGIIKAEVARRRGHKPIRKLMTEAGPAVKQIKPVFLMSPISVAQYLPPGVLDFDLLVIDEASQVRPEDALGVVARCKQIVVVGDKKQLPPTDFFSRLVSDNENEENDEDDVNENPEPKVTGAAELESILSLCEARGLKQRMLKWHYRSRHPSLIEVSNELFYQDNGGLMLFPSPNASRENDGFSVKRVKGAYDRGGKRNNPIEAEAVARAVAEHAKTCPQRSLGVVTFSTAQRDQVTYWLDKLRQEDDALDAFMQEGKDEPFFVKNIENVQGDERDTIYVSVGYGPRLAGQRLDSMAFGPINSDGGERRLNVLFTRARYCTKVFVSFDSGDIDLKRTTKPGAAVLKRFLHFAETGELHEASPLGQDPDTEFEIAVANTMRGMGYEVDYQVGSGGYSIDLAVRHPEYKGRYMLAVECDGATYHSAVSARERDRLRQEVLEGLGWNFHRVWSTDWFHRRDEEIARLKAAIDAAVERGNQPPEDTEIIAAPSIDDDLDHTLVLIQQALPEYVAAELQSVGRREPHDLSPQEMSVLALRVIEIEGPVHQEEIARRIATGFGKQKVGSRIMASVQTSLLYLKKRNADITDEGGFWMTSVQKSKVPLRSRANAPLTARKASMIPPIEISSAIKRTLKENGILSREEIPKGVANLFGFQRTGPEFRPVVEPLIDELVMAGLITDETNGFSLKN